MLLVVNSEAALRCASRIDKQERSGTINGTKSEAKIKKSTD